MELIPMDYRTIGRYPQLSCAATTNISRLTTRVTSEYTDTICLQLTYMYVASYPGLPTPVFVACTTNMREGLVKVVMCSDIDGCWVDAQVVSGPGIPRQCTNFEARAALVLAACQPLHASGVNNSSLFNAGTLQTRMCTIQCHCDCS